MKREKRWEKMKLDITIRVKKIKKHEDYKNAEHGSRSGCDTGRF